MKNCTRSSTVAIAITMSLAASCSSPSPTSPSSSRSTPVAAGAEADLVLLGGRVVGTKDATAIACRDGRIVFVGTDSGARRFVTSRTRLFPLAGATIVPGLTDAHGHMLGLGEALVRVDLVGTSSYAEVIERTSTRAASTPQQNWVLGRGWDQNDWSEKAFPTHAALSERTPDHPVFLRRVDGHAGLANAAALLLAGVTRDTKDPDGGRILRDPATGEPTGVFVDNAMDLVERVIPEPTHDEKAALLRRAMQECVENGLTEVHDAGVDLDTIACYRELAARGEMPLRVYAMIAGGGTSFATDPATDSHGANPTLDAFLARGPEVGAADGLLTIRAVKLYADGALGSRGAALLEAYSDEPGNVGLLVTDPAELHAVTVRCLKAGLQVCVHAIGDRGNRVVLDAFEQALAEVPAASRGARLRIEHAQVLAPDDLPRLARLGVVASMQPTHATSDMPWAEARLGHERARGAYAWRSLLQSGAQLAFGSDFPVESVSPLFGLYAAITRQDETGKPAGGWFADQNLTPAEALAGFTSGAAFAAFEEADGGTIALGKRADLTALSADPLTANPRELRTARVIATVVRGRVVFGSPSPPQN
ncbi:MAG: amidohydrolase [Planctomycetes bacterium]|nr:amidohydrolase [Planctomycetota bacterium]